MVDSFVNEGHVYLGENLLGWNATTDPNYHGNVYLPEQRAPNVFKENKINVTFRSIQILKPNDIYIPGNNFRESCFCCYNNTNNKYICLNGKKLSSRLFVCESWTYSSLNDINNYNLVIKCLDHASMVKEGDYSILNSSTVSNSYIQESDVITLNFSRVEILNLSFLNKTDGKYYENVSVHSHGGYSAQLIVDTTYDTQNMRLSDIIINVDDKYVNPLETTKFTNTIVNFIMPPTSSKEGKNADLKISFDHGITFSSPIQFEISGLCHKSFFCEDFRKQDIPMGHFCDLDPQTEYDKYCQWARPCPPGTYTYFKKNITYCKKVKSGYYLNYWGADKSIIPPKKCPKGFVCKEEGLPKYYEICPPGRKCLNEGMTTTTSQPVSFYSDVFKKMEKRDEIDCGVTNFCPIGVLSEDYTNRNNFVDSVIDTDEKFKDMSRLFSFSKAFNFTESEFKFINHLCVNECSNKFMCTNKHEYSDVKL